ncbi:hypothetical protein HKX48_002710 [Thoreauomyces humboldtii]|nr:hypothetical protein HKX48_002710 [Thoreauomyces humboldtii]
MGPLFPPTTSDQEPGSPQSPPPQYSDDILQFPVPHLQPDSSTSYQQPPPVPDKSQFQQHPYAQGGQDHQHRHSYLPHASSGTLHFPAPPAPSEHSLEHLADTSADGVVESGPVSAYFGPYLRYGNVDYTRGMWTGSILVLTRVARPSSLTLTPTPAIGHPTTLWSNPIQEFRGYTFHRFDLALPMAQQEVVWKYVVDADPTNAWEFHVAAIRDTRWRFSFNSCNGFSASITPAEREKLGGVGALWKDVMRQHRTPGSAFHCQIGGGDQIYGDPMWKALPSLQHWLAQKGKENRKCYAWSSQLEDDVAGFYFKLYTSHFATPNLREAVACIPSIYQIDDHDIFDGWGSYPDYLQHSIYFQNIGRLAFEMYHLFQQHTTQSLLAPGQPHQNERFSPDGKTFHFIKLLGPSVAVVGPDTRAERTPTQILSPQSYDMIFHHLSQLPSTVRHVVWMLAVPIVYPRLEMPETLLAAVGKTKRGANDAVNSLGKGLGTLAGVSGKLLDKLPGVHVDAAKWKSSTKGAYDGAMGHVKKGLGKTGLMSGLISQFGEIDLLDDMCDHWTHALHKEERATFIRRMQAYSYQFRRRSTFISGDVHACGYGLLSNPNAPVDRDPSWMLQVIASAIVNVPPPGGVLKLVHRSAKKIDFGDGVQETMMETFVKDVDGKDLAGKIMMGRRNWGVCRVGVVGEALEFVIRVEGTQEVGACVPYPPVIAPALI